MSGTPNPVRQITGLANTSNVSKADLISWALSHVPQVLADASDINARDLAGQLIIYNLANRRAYMLDTGDSSTPDNGTTCIRDFNGLAFKIADSIISDGTVYEIVALTQAEYDALSPPNATTFYIITDSGETTRTRQVFTSGSGTYTLPANCKYINVRMVGGGGGGGGGGTSGGGGGNGGNTTFGTSLLAANGGGGGQASGGGGNAAGGDASGGDINISGGSTDGINSAGTISPESGRGASSPFAGGGGCGFGFSGGSGAGVAAPTNSGAGGGGGGNQSGTGFGLGGAAGAYLEKLIGSPLSTYSYAVGTSGTAGTAGTGGSAGGAGGSGIIIVDEFYV